MGNGTTKRESSLNKPTIILLFVLVVCLDLLFTQKYNDTVMAAMAPAQLLITTIDIISAWLVLVSALLLTYFVLSLISSKFVFSAAKLLFFLALCCLISVAVFVWYFYAKNGYAPSIGVILFILDNMARAPQHILQTSPVTAVLFVVVCVLVAYISYKLIGRFIQLSSLRHMVLVFILLSMSSLTSYYIKNNNIELVATSPVTYITKSLVSAKDFVPDTDVKSNFIRRVGGQPDNQQLIEDVPVIVIMIESLRHDLMHHNPSPFPFMKAITSEGIFFDRAYASASHSDYADLAFWYSRYPLRTQKRQTYPKNAEWKGKSIFTILKEHDYETAYISSQNEKWGGMINWLDTEDVDYFYHSEDYDGETWVNRDDSNGLIRLMNKGIATAGKLEDSVTINVAKDWIRSLNGKQRFLMGINLQNTHFSYVVPEGGEEPFKPSELGFSTVYYNWPENKKEHVRNRYFNAVYNLDKLINDFIVFLKQVNIWDKSIVIILGDSGEAFYEHGFGNHSGPMYEEVMRTYAFMKPVKSSITDYPAVYEKPISHIDFAAMILDMLGIKKEPDFQGVSPLSNKNRAVFMHSNAIVKQQGVVKWPWKALSTYYPRREVELYNLIDDPMERHNLYSQNKSKANELINLIEFWESAQILYYSDPVYYKNYYPPSIMK
ncbi:MAG: sulfatase-like hydrolase/transferase [Candidatus Thiodiazotropha endolucinida]